MVIDESTARKHGLTLDSVLLMLAIHYNPKIFDLVNTLMESRLIENTLFKDYLVLKDSTKETIDLILSESELVEKPKSFDYNELARKLMELYPKGRKVCPDGRSYSWRDSVAVIANKLKTLRIKYNFEYTEEQAINAVSKYVEKNMDNQYMQVLKYYLLKVVPDGIQSEFMSDIQNEGENEEPTDWTTELV